MCYVEHSHANTSRDAIKSEPGGGGQCVYVNLAVEWPNICQHMLLCQHNNICYAVRVIGHFVRIIICIDIFV